MSFDERWHVAEELVRALVGRLVSARCRLPSLEFCAHAALAVSGTAVLPRQRKPAPCRVRKRRRESAEGELVLLKTTKTHRAPDLVPVLPPQYVRWCLLPCHKKRSDAVLSDEKTTHKNKTRKRDLTS